MKTMIENELLGHKAAIEAVLATMLPEIEKACALTVETFKNGKKVLLMGNGGSAGDAQHVAAEFTGRYKTERRGLPAVALTTDTSALTAIGNDYGFQRVFDRQVEALATEGDLLIAFSTSGNSENVIRALELGKKIGCRSIGFSGKGGGKMKGLCDVDLIIPSDDTPRIQEMHITVGHIVCQAVDDQLS